MNIDTQRLLANYVIQLIVVEGFQCIHVGSIIPNKNNLNEKRKWSQFVDLEETILNQLDVVGIKYDRLSGWFSKKETKNGT